MNILNKHDPTIVIDNNNNKKDVDAEEDTTFNGKTQQHHLRSSTHRGVNYMNPLFIESNKPSSINKSR